MKEWSDELLDEKRAQGDPLADETIAVVFDHRGVDGVNRVLRHLQSWERGHFEGGDLEPVIREHLDRYLEESARLPEWLDPERIELAEELFLSDGLTTILALWNSSLPETYTLADMAAVLCATGRLTRHTNRRLHETARFVIPVMNRHGLDPKRGGEGIVQTQKVRLIHGAIRHLLLEDAEPGSAEPTNVGEVLVGVHWDPEERGYPINQELLAFVLLSFSYVILRSLRIMGARWRPDEERAYLHAWNVVGAVLGVDEDLMAWTMPEAELLFETIKRRRARSTADGCLLMARLVDVTVRAYPEGMLRDMPWLLPRMLLGDETADLLGIPRDHSVGGEALFRIGFSALRVFNSTVNLVEAEFPPAQWLTDEVSARLLDHLVAVSEDPDDPSRPLQIPDHLRRRWRLAAEGGASRPLRKLL